MVQCARVLVLTLLLCTSVAAGGGEDAGLPAVPGVVRRPMVAGDYQAALVEIAALKGGLPEQLDQWLYLEASALSHADRLEEAVVVAAELEAGFPLSPWMNKARFLRADLYTRLHRHAEAEEIWEAEAKRLLSDGRKRELAAIYLDAADGLTVAPDPSDPGAPAPDWPRAHELYRRVLTLAAPRDVEARALFGMARSLEEQGDDPGAAGAFRAYLQAVDPSFGGTSLAAEAARLESLEARLRLGSAELASGQRAGARRTLEDLEEDLAPALAGEGPYGPFEESEHLAELGRIEGDALYALSRTWSSTDALELPLAVAALRRFLATRPAHADVPQAHYDIGEIYRAAGRHEEALAAFDAFLADPLRLVTDEEARVRAAELRQAALFHKGWIQQRQQRHADAIATYQDYVGRFPTGSHWAAAQQAIVDCEYEIGAAQRRDGAFAAAREEWRGFLDRHPLDARAAQIALDVGGTFVDEADALDEGAAGERGLLQQAIAQWRRVNGKHPGSQHASEAMFRIADLYEGRLGDLEAAVEAYRACNFGPRHGDALERLDRMTSPDLSLVTERTYRTDEPARVLAQVRNVEALTVELYRIDLESYFRKHLTHRSVESLDLDLIAPDRVLQVDVEGYASYAPLEQTLEVEMDGPGVWAVVAIAEELRATTLLLRSDVDIVVKSSLRELFVFAEDVREGVPAEGTRILVGMPRGGEDGAVFVEAFTGPDGVARVDLSEHEGVDDVRVLAMRDGSVAAEGVGLGGLGLAQGLTPRGFVFTERPAYQPGQTVRVRAVLRDVADGAYTFTPGQLQVLEVLDPGGRVVSRRELPLSRFGTVAADVALDARARTGTYTVTVRTPGGTPYSGNFPVEEYRLQPVELVLETEEDVYHRGERVEVVARAAWYYGEPLAGARLRYTLPDGRVGEAETGADGSARFDFDTRDYLRGGALQFSASLVEEGVGAAGSVYVAVRGFGASVSVARGVVLAGESFAASLRTSTPAGDPVGRDLVLRVYRRESSPDGTWGEVLVEERGLATDEEAGEGQVSLSLEQGGWHVLRAEGTDRFANPVVAETTLFVSGDADEVMLRFLVDDAQLDVGERVSIVLNNRDGAGLALVTFEGETVFDHRIVHLQAGRNELAFDVDHTHFPNFVLAVARMDGSELHTAQTEFGVARELRVEIVAAEDVVRPGGEASLALRVTDQLGRPVETELSIGVVDDALYDQYGELHGSLTEFFDVGARRHAALRTTSSCTFSYQGVTARIAEELLAEARRQQLQSARAGRLEDISRALSVVDAQSDALWAAGLATTGSDDFFLGSGVQMDGLGPPEAEFDSQSFNSAIGIGGGAGGRFGGRRGMRRAKGKAGEGSAADAAGHRADETAFWAPAVVTDAEGRAEVVFTLPARSTRWRVTVHGVSAETVLGEARARLTTRADFAVELKAPGALTEGDRPRLVARVHNLTGHAGEVEVRLRIDVAGRVTSVPATVSVPAEGVAEHTFPALEALPLAESFTLQLVAEAELGGEARFHSLFEELPLRPWGLAVADAQSGSLSGDRTLWLELPGEGPHRGRSLELYLGPGARSLLVDEALGRTSGFGGGSIATRDDAAGDLFGLCAVIAYLRGAGLSDHPELARLIDRAEGRVAHLVATQHTDGGWSWGGAKSTDVGTSALALAALGRARDLALAVPPDVVASAIGWAEGAFRGAVQNQDERKAMLQWALAAHGRADFGALNRLHRERGRLTQAALSYTALALADLGNGPMAAEVAAGLEEDRSLVGVTLADGTTGCLWRYVGNDAWSRSEVEGAGLALLALGRALPASAWIEKGVAGLLERRPFGPARARGIALAALAQHYGVTETRDDALTVTVLVDGRQVESVSLVGGAAGHRIEVPGTELVDARVRVDLEVAGRGALIYSAALRGTTPTVARRDGPGLRVTAQELLAAGPRHLGRELPHGFAVLHGEHERWANEVRHLELGDVAHARVEFHQSLDANAPQEELDYLVLDVPLPAGVTVLDGSISGAYDSVEVLDGLLRFHVGLRRWGNAVTYSFVGRAPGSYRQLPPVLRSANRPDRFAVWDPGAMDVLARGEESPDEYRPTPDVQFHLGKALYGEGDGAGAWEQLMALYDTWEANLHESPLRQTAEMLLFLAIERGEAPLVVRYFEVLKERNPGLVIPFEEVLAVGEAYRALEEHERASLVFRATIEETFGKDLKVAGALEEQGGFLAAIATLEDLWLEFPDTPAVRSAYLTSADKLLTKAPLAHGDAGLREAGIDRADLELAGIALLQRYLALYPTDPTAPDAGLNLVSTFLGLEDFERASEEAGRFAARYTDPRYADAFLYTQAVADWHQGLDDEARDLLSGIAEAEYVGDDGVRSPSINRDLSLYILGQIHHARQEPDEAIAYYERVAEQFPDAREAIAGFREKVLGLEEVTVARPGEPVEITVEHRNLEDAELLVYAVDLMTLYLREKDLSRVTSVNLAGIAPVVRESVSLGGGGALRPEESSFELPLEEPGAYLVIARGGELHTSGLVLVSSLELEVREDPLSGRLRVQVLDHATGGYLRDVDVRVVGSASGEIMSGETDPRGLFVADGVSGVATVIARLGEEGYAFHRGRTVLGEEPQAPAAQRGFGGGDTGKQDKEGYLRNVLMLNEAQQEGRFKAWAAELDRERAGVQVQQVQ